MRNNGIRRLAGTVLIGTIAFAAQVQAQQQGQAGQTRPERSAEGRGARGEKLDPAKMVERRMSGLTEHLKLSSGQTTAIRQILLDEQAQMETLRPAGGSRRTAGDSAARGERRERPDSAARAQGRAQMEALRARTDTRIEAVLSGQQRTAYRELVAKRGGRSEGGRGGRGSRKPNDGRA